MIYGKQSMGKGEKMAEKWIRLDNAAKIYPAAMSRKWMPMFRLSLELDEAVDPDILRAAASNLRPGFPSFFKRLRKGLFWPYLEDIDGEPPVLKDVANPLARMDLDENGGFTFRIRYHNNRIAVEFFHVVTDGYGGLVFIKNLAAEYLRLKYDIEIPFTDDIMDISKEPDSGMTEDSFIRYARDYGHTKPESLAYHIKGTKEPDDYLKIITGTVPVDELREKSRSMGISITEFIVSLLIMSARSLQKKDSSLIMRKRPVKISVPVNLRRFYPSKTVRNFSSYVNPGIDPRYGDYSFEETADAVHHFMGAEVTEKMLNAKFSDNVNKEKIKAVRVLPLFIKNAVMRLYFRRGGDRTTTSTLTNLGAVSVPSPMDSYVRRFDFMLGPLSYMNVNCAAVSYKGMMNITFTRKIRETEFERYFFTELVEMGIKVTVESNNRY